MLTTIAVVLVAQVLQPTPPAPAPPIPQGQRIDVKDGDTVVIPGSARVRVIRRTKGTVRILYNPATRSIAILYDVSDPSGAPPDGKVDGSFSFEDVEGVWPLGERWQGTAVIDEYLMTQRLLRVGMGITTDAGLVQLFSVAQSARESGPWFQEPRAAAVLYYNASGGAGSFNMSFDQAEQIVMRQAARDAEMRAARKGNSAQTGGFNASVTQTIEPGPGGITLTPVDGTQPVRVGGAIALPRKVVDAQPVYPPIAQSARVQGVVILEITVGTDGSVRNAKVLRSIPLLDQAALDCVRQWKYEPTQLNGTPVPVIMTVTVNFALQDGPPEFAADQFTGFNRARLDGGHVAVGR
jgi:TonB family protein